MIELTKEQKKKYRVFKKEFWIKRIDYKFRIHYEDNRYYYRNYWIAKDYFEYCLNKS